MKILNVYYGTNAYDFDAQAHHYTTNLAADDNTVEYAIEVAEQHLRDGKCVWYCALVTELNTRTGMGETKTYYGGVAEKSKIILNAKAKHALKPPSAPLKWPAAFINDLEVVA